MNGHGGKDYVAILEHMKGGRLMDTDKDKERLEQMILNDEMDN